MDSKTISQTPSPLPPSPVHGVLTTAQWRIFAAVLDAVIAPIVPEQNATSDAYSAVPDVLYGKLVNDIQQGQGKCQDAQVLATQYLAEAATSSPDLEDCINRLMGSNMDSVQKQGLLFIVNALDTRAGAMLLTGTSTPLYDLPVSKRESILQSWATARLPVYRSLFHTFTLLGMIYWIRHSPTLGRILAYPRSPVNHNFGTGFPFSFLQVPASTSNPTSPEIIETDVLVVGSGCTGAVAASVLAKAGLSVLVADKSYYWPPNHLPMSESSAATHLFQNGGVTLTDDGYTAIISGSCWGGGGTVNWSASLQLQGFVREAWASHNLPYFTSPAFQADMDAVCERMGVGTAHVEHNFGNRQLLEGARKLGMNAKVVPQNTGGEAHQCGYCTLGCGSCGKKGPTESWLPDAARAGAQFIEGFECLEVLFDDKKDRMGNRVAIGARGIWTSRDSASGVVGSDRYKREVIIKARRAVIVTSGALNTPLLLLRSGLKNPHIGRHLHVHPVNLLGAVYDDDVRPWEGPILTSVVNDLENLDRRGHGVKLEATTMIPGLFLAQFAWQSALQFKTFAAKMRRMTGYISLARDEGEGLVYPDAKDNRCVRVRYAPSKADKQRIAQGLEALAKIQYVGGAREIFVTVPGVPTFVREDAAVVGQEEEEEEAAGVNDPAFQAWLEHLRRLSTHGHPSNTGFATAHQMGSARMGSSPKTSVVDPNGAVWGTSGLYVADTSVFPAASGVNPMITSMATARGIARKLVKSLGLNEAAGEAARARL